MATNDNNNPDAGDGAALAAFKVSSDIRTTEGIMADFLRSFYELSKKYQKKVTTTATATNNSIFTWTESGKERGIFGILGQSGRG